MNQSLPRAAAILLASHFLATHTSAQFIEPVRIIQEWRGEAENDQFGWIARNIGDVDNDGVSDVVISAPTNSQAGKNAGKIYVYSSKTGKLLWSATGEPNWQLGTSLEAAGDINNDTVPDVVAGAPGGARAIVYSGKDGKRLHTLRSNNKNDGFGGAVSDIGDWNNDGHNDILVGAPKHESATGKNTGTVYLFSGKDAAILLSLEGQREEDNFGSTVAGVATNNLRMILVGAPNAGRSQGGAVYVYKDNPPILHSTINAEDTGKGLGYMFISIVGDVDADGHPDIYASDWNDTSKGKNTGKTYIVSGRTGKSLHTFTGESAGEGFGIGVADAGDIDHDGHDDLVIGAWQHATGAKSAGRVSIYSGATGERIRTITCNIKDDTFGFDATGIGDVDNDSELDLLIASAWSEINGQRSGRVFIIAGEKTKSPEKPKPSSN